MYGWGGETKRAITYKKYHKMVASGEWNTSLDATENKIGKLDSRLWLLDFYTKEKEAALKKTIQSLYTEISTLKRTRCNCSVKCRGKSARDRFSEIEDQMSELRSRIFNLEYDVEEIERENRNR
jgi:hypothetical protein